MSLSPAKRREINLVLLCATFCGEQDCEGLIDLVSKQLKVPSKFVSESLLFVSCLSRRAYKIDASLSKFSSIPWSLVGHVEKSILRLACYELVYCLDVPSAVVISESIRLARKFTGPESTGFVSGVISAFFEDIKASKLESI